MNVVVMCMLASNDLLASRDWPDIEVWVALTEDWEHALHVGLSRADVEGWAAERSHCIL